MSLTDSETFFQSTKFTSTTCF